MAAAARQTAAGAAVPFDLQVSAWFLALLIPTLALKAAYVWTMSGGDLEVVQAAGGVARIPAWWLFLGHIFPADVIDVTLAVAVLALLARAFAAAGPWLALMMMGLVMVAGGAELLALRELGALMTLDTLRAALNWSMSSLLVVPAFLTPRRMVLALAGVLWMATPVLLPRLLYGLTGGRASSRRAAVVGLAAVVGWAFVQSAAVSWPAGDADRSPLVQGIWRMAVQSLVRGDLAPPPDVTGAPSGTQTMAEYAELAFPNGRSSPEEWLIDIPRERRVPRHIILVLLETAPRAFFDVDESEHLPTLQAMRARAIVADRHYATTPMSSLALYSLLSGTYPRPGASIARYGAFRSDSLPERLRRRGYETVHIDSYDLSWNGPDEEQALRSLGIETVLDARQGAPAVDSSQYSRRLGRDRQSFDLALAQVLNAERRGRHAFVSLATHLGHFDWPAPPDAVDRSSRARLAAAARAVDALIGQLLSALAAAGLRDDAIVVVTGDHGLRFRAEFAALDLPLEHGDVMYHVPMLIFAPGLLDGQVRVPYVTSHVDLAPTLLDLTGTERDDAVHHGHNMLDARVAERLTFWSSGAYPGLAPVDGVHWRGTFYTWHRVADRVLVQETGTGSVQEGAATGAGPDDVDVRAVISASRRLFNQTAALFLKRAQEPGEEVR